MSTSLVSVSTSIIYFMQEQILNQKLMLLKLPHKTNSDLKQKILLPKQVKDRQVKKSKVRKLVDLDQCVILDY